jgi:hypothetical protein
MNVLPSPKVLTTQILPPCASIVGRQQQWDTFRARNKREIGGFELSGIDSRCRRKTVPEIEQADGASAATEQAEERTRETRGFMRSVRRATRRKYTSTVNLRSHIDFTQNRSNGAESVWVEPIHLD